MQQSSQPGWCNPRVLLIFAVIFLCGTAFGSLATRAYLHSRMPPVDPHLLPVENARRLGVRSLKELLALAPEQEHTIMVVLDEYSKYYQNIEDERQDVAEHGRMNIMKVLNPEQQRKFNELFPQARASGVN